jgi:hypothetical protein
MTVLAVYEAAVVTGPPSPQLIVYVPKLVFDWKFTVKAFPLQLMNCGLLVYEPSVFSTRGH